VSKDVKGVDNCKEFFIVNFVVALCWQQGLGVIHNGMPTIQGIWLFQNCSGGKVTGISDKSKWFPMVWQGKHWSFCEYHD